MPEKVPLWIIRNTFCSYGSKMPPRPETINRDAKQCATCNKWLNTFQEWDYWQGEYYCREHYERIKIEKPYVTTFSNHGYTPRAIGNQMERIAELYADSGNLDEGRYKFWIGEKQKVSLRSQCRACDEIVWGEDMRMEHIESSKELYRADVSCCFVLSVIHKKLLELKKCAVCGGSCFSQKWGIPICSVPCVRIWKFDSRKIYPEVERLLQPMFKPTIQKSGGLITLDSGSSQTSKSSQESDSE